MKRYRLVYRGSRNAYYCFDTETNKRESLGTGNSEEAQRLIDTKNEAVRHSGMNLQIAQVSPAMLSTSSDAPLGATTPAAENCPDCRPARTGAAAPGCPQSRDRRAASI